MLVVDLDRFKGINDNFGHATGDRALQEIGKALSAALGSSPIVGRWGGDEFAAIVEHVNSGRLRGFAERCRVAVQDTSVLSPDGTPVALSVSIGGTLALLDDSIESLFKRADMLMYECKAAGRGRVGMDESTTDRGRTKRRAV